MLVSPAGRPLLEPILGSLKVERLAAVLIHGTTLPERELPAQATDPALAEQRRARAVEADHHDQAGYDRQRQEQTEGAKHAVDGSLEQGAVAVRPLLREPQVAAGDPRS